jgi:hypothetical protein
LPYDYFEAFGEAFKQALYYHCRKRSTVIDNEMLERSFRRARAMARKRSSAAPTLRKVIATD